MSWTRRRLLGASVGLPIAPTVLRSAAARCDGRVAKIATEFAGWSIDPLRAVETDDAILRNILAPLVRFDGTAGRIAPHLAESWELHDEGRLITITLRQERWTNRTDIQSEDVVLSIERLAGTDQFKRIKGAQQRGQKTVEIHLHEADPDLVLTKLPTRLGCILSTALREQILAREEAVKSGSMNPLTFSEVIDGRYMITSGTYHLVSLDSNKATLQLAPTWLGPLPRYERVEFVNIPGLARGSQEAYQLAQAMFLQGEICAYPASEGFSGFQRIALRKAQVSGVSYTFPSARTYVLVMRADNESELPREFRKAIGATLDPDTTSASLTEFGAFDTALRGTASLLPAIVDFESPEPDRNLEESEAVLQQFGRKLRLVWPISEDPYYELVGMASAAVLEQHGLSVETRGVDFRALVDDKEPFDVVVMRQDMYPNSAFDILRRFTTGHRLNLARLHRSDFDKLIEDGSTTLDLETRRQLGSDALRVLMQDDIVAAPLAEAYTTWTVAPEVKPDFTPYGAIGDLALWT